MTKAEARLHFQDIRFIFPVLLPRLPSLEHYYQVNAKYSLSHWDSLLVAACIDAGVQTLYSEDMQAGANDDGVNIINPFRP